MTNTKKFFKDIGFMGISHLFLSIEGFLLIPLLTKFMSTENFGIWSQIKITYLLLGAISLMGLEAAIIRFVSGNIQKQEISKKFITGVSISGTTAIVLGSLLFIFAKPISVILTGTLLATTYFQLAAALLIIQIISALLSSLFQAQGKIKQHSIIEIIRGICEIVIAFILLKAGLNIYAIISAVIISKVISIILYLIKSKNEIIFVKPNYNTAKELLAFCLPFTIAPMLFWILQSADQYVLGAIHGAAQVGIYAVAYSLSRIIRIIADPILSTMVPAMTSAWNNKNEEYLNKLFNYSYRMIFMLTIPALVGITILSKPILTIISRAEYATNQFILPIISLGVLLYLYFGLGTIFLNLKKQMGKITKVLVVLAIVNIILNFILIPSLSVVGAAIATCITFAIAGLYGIYEIKKMQISLLPISISKYVLASIPMGAITYYVQSFPTGSVLIKLVIIAIISPTLYFIILLILKEISKKDIIFVKNLIIKPKST